MPPPIFADLVRHKWHANAAYLAAVDPLDAARRDAELLKLFNHILFSNRFWLFLALGREFDREKEVVTPETLDPLIDKYKETEALEMEWLSRCDDAELHRPLATPRLPGQTFTVEEVMMQICLHSHGHRVQLAGKLRNLDCTPPRSDFVLWLKDRPAPEWPSAANASKSSYV